jgi:hypothetical protein
MSSPHPFPIRMGRNQLLKLWKHLAVTAQAQIRFDPLLDRVQPLCFEARYLRSRDLHISQIHKRLTPPKRERLLERLARDRGRGWSCLGNKLPEPHDATPHSGPPSAQYPFRPVSARKCKDRRHHGSVRPWVINRGTSNGGVNRGGPGATLTPTPRPYRLTYGKRTTRMVYSPPARTSTTSPPTIV